MDGAISISEALSRLSPEPGLVVLMCGVAGSGKTTFSRRLEAQGFHRISIDETIWEASGRYGIDYPAEVYDEKLARAREILRARLETLLAERQSVVVDSAFWSKDHRRSFTSLVASKAGRHQLVYLKVAREELRSRLEQRSLRFNANAALPIDNSRLDAFIESFEAPGPDENPVVVSG